MIPNKDKTGEVSITYTNKNFYEQLFCASTGI